MFVPVVVRFCSCFCKRPAVKNHRRSFMSGPPTVYSYVGTVLCSLAFVRVGSARACSYGVRVRQLSLLNDCRYEPLKVLPPDFVMAFTTPPPKRPYSAEMPLVAMVVS